MRHEVSTVPSVTTGEDRPSGFVFVTPVWGESYTQLFVDTALPCQLSAGNIPGLSNLPGSTYMIVTTESDAEIIRAAPIFRPLAEMIDTRIILIKDEIVVPHETMSDCYRHGIALAEQRGAALIFLTPDCIVADGGFVALERLAMRGLRVVYVTGIRTLKQAVQLQLRQIALPDGTVTVAPRTLARIALDSMHPMARSSLWEEDGYDLVPANLLWRVGDEGLVARCYHLHPLLVFPEQRDVSFRSTIDDDYVQIACPDTSKHYIVQDSDEVLVIELSDPERRFITGLRKGTIQDVAVWAERYADKRHRELIETTIRLHTDIGDVAAWQETEADADRVVAHVRGLLRRSTLRLMFTNPRALNGRLLRQAQDRRALLAASQAEAASGDHPGYGTTGGEAAMGGSSLLHWMSFGPAIALDTLFQGYGRAIRFLVRSIQVADRRLLGTYDRATCFSITGHYYRQLKRDLDAAIQELGSSVISCVDPASAVGVIVNAQDGTRHQAVCVAIADAVRLCSRQDGELLPDGAASGLFIDIQSCNGNDPGSLCKEASRILADTGRVAIKSDWLPNPSHRESELRMHLSQYALTELLRSDFDVVSLRRQGRIGTAITGMMYVWARRMAMRLRLPAGIMVLTSLVLLPLHLMIGLGAHISAFALDKLDKTERFYVSSIVVAQKRAVDSRADDAPPAA